MKFQDFKLSKDEMKSVSGGGPFGMPSGPGCNHDPSGIAACNASSSTHYDYSMCCCIHTSTGQPV